jgi:pyrroline-5-carboxylate reductase
MTEDVKILLVGCGAMGTALYKGWLKRGGYQITIVDPHAPEALSHVGLLNPDYQPDVILFAVKPQIAHEVVAEYKSFTDKPKQPIFLSIMAGISIKTIEEILENDPLVIRAMPNLAAIVSQGMTGLTSRKHLTPHQSRLAEEIFSSVGEIIWLNNEQQINAVTAISGSGPAYFFFFVEALTQAGLKLGLSPEQSVLLARQTLIGAASILKNSQDSAADWCRKVTSPQGTTAAALSIFEEGGLSELVAQATDAAFNRAHELGK